MPKSEDTKQKLYKAVGQKTVTQKSVSECNWSKEPGRLGKEEVIVTGRGMFPIRTNRVSYYKDYRFKVLHDSQKGKP